jgi:WD40 repeat protein
MTERSARVGGLAPLGVRAVLVGTGTHAPESPLPAVPAAADTVRDLAKVLFERCGLAEDSTSVLVDPSGPEEVGRTLTEAAKEAIDVLLFYYVGHGLISPGCELYLATRATKDLTEGLPVYQALPYSTVRDALADSEARCVIVVLDCCFSGRAYGSLGGAADDGFALSYVHGSYLLTSAAGAEFAWAVEGKRHTAFSGELIRLLREGDAFGPPQLTVGHLYQHLVRVLPAQGFPMPRCQAVDRIGEIVLATNPAYQPPVRHRAERVQESPTMAAEQTCPYRGLAAFGPQDARYFYGRDRLTGHLLRKLVERMGQPGPLVVVGPSGSGKSSLLRAGLLPGLANGRMPLAGSHTWPALVFTPGVQPLATLANKLARRAGADPDTLRTALTHDPSMAAAAVIQTLRRRATRARVDAARLVIVVDQFEELFTLCPDEGERKAFIDALCAVSRPSPNGAETPAVVVLGVRADFYPHCAAYPELVAAMQDTQVVVGPMASEELRQAIEKPAWTAGLALEEGLVDLLLHELGADTPSGYGAGRLPLLSHALLETWQQREGRILTLAGYQATGGIRNAVARTAEHTFGSLDTAEQEGVRNLLLRMVAIGHGTEDTRRRVNLADLLHGHSDSETGANHRALNALVNARLVTTDQNMAEISHEALIAHWPRLRQWIETDRTGLLVHQQLTDAAEAWQRGKQEPSFLYSGARLATAFAWAQSVQRHSKLNQTEQAFLDASVQRERHRIRRLAQGIIGLVVLLILVVGISLVAFQQRAMAVRQQRIAKGRELAAKAEVLRESRPGVSLMLSIEALRRNPSAEARAGLVTTLTQTHYAGTLTSESGTVDAMAFSPDGHTLATATRDHTVNLWDVSQRASLTRLASLTGQTHDVSRVTFSPDGHMLATASDVTVDLWDVSNRAHPARLASLAADAGTGAPLAFSPDGYTLATASDDHTVILWDISNRSHLTRLARLTLKQSTQQGTIPGVTFSPDRHTMATTTFGGPAILWDVSDRAHPVRLATVGDEYASDEVAFSRDGRRVATGGGYDGTVTLWDVSARTNPAPLATTRRDRGNPVNTMVFSPVGAMLATVHSDNRITLWDVSNPTLPTQLVNLTGHTDDVIGAVFSPDGRMLVTASFDKTVILWHVRDLADPEKEAVLPPRGANGPNVAVFSPDGRTLITANGVQPVTLWDASSRTHLSRLISFPKHLNPTDVASSRGGAFISPDGHTLATPSDDKTVSLWDISDRLNPTQLATVTGYTDWSQLQSAVAFSPDGRTIATIDKDSAKDSALLWDLADRTHPSLIASLIGDHGLMHGMAFSPDGRTMATISSLNVILWDLSDRAHPKRLANLSGGGTGFTGAAFEVVFSPDGHTLAALLCNRTVFLWNISDHTRPSLSATLTGRNSSMYSVAFSPDGNTLATANDLGEVILWDGADPFHAERITTLSLAENPTKVAFSPDGRTLVTDNGTVTLWDLSDLTFAVAHPVAQACRIAGPGLSQSDWTRYIPDMTYKRSCP